VWELQRRADGIWKTDEARVRRAQRKQKKELRALVDKISTYGRRVHQRYPTGDVVVSEHDSAEQLRKRPDAVATALNLLLGEQKSPEGSAEWILEAERLISIGVRLTVLSLPHGCLLALLSFSQAASIASCC
jgi:hypothetical protein